MNMAHQICVVGAQAQIVGQLTQRFGLEAVIGAVTDIAALSLARNVIRGPDIRYIRVYTTEDIGSVKLFIRRRSGPYRLGDVFGAIFAALEQYLHGDEAAGPAGAVGAANGDADRIRAIRGDADRLAEIVARDEFLLHRIPRDGEHPHGGRWDLTFRHDARPPGPKQLPSTSPFTRFKTVYKGNIHRK